MGRWTRIGLAKLLIITLVTSALPIGVHAEDGNGITVTVPAPLYSWGFDNGEVQGSTVTNQVYQNDSESVATLRGNAVVVNDDQRGEVLSLPGGAAGGGWLSLPNNLYSQVTDLTVEYGQKNSLQTDYHTQVTNFATCRAAIMQQGIWTQLQMDKINPDLDIGFLPMPINDNAEAMDKLQVGVPNYWVVLKSSKVKEDAKAFLNWLVTSEAGKKFIVEDAKLIPAFKSIPASEDQLGPLAADIMKAVKEGKTLPWMWQRYPGYEADTSQMAVQIQAYIGKKIDKERMFQEFQNIWEDVSDQ